MILLILPWLFVFLYGALFLTGLFLTPFWAATAYRRIGQIGHRWGLLSDRSFILAAGISVVSLGDTVAFAIRTYGYLKFGVDYTAYDGLRGVMLTAGLVIVLAGKALLVWLADLERHPPDWRWSKVGAATVLAWAVASGALELSGGLP